MHIEKLDENQIRIFLNLEDLQKRNIDLHTFMSNPLETQNLVLDVLDAAEAEVGFYSHNYNLSVEALTSLDGNFVLTITRINPKDIELDLMVDEKNVLEQTGLNSYIYIFNNFNDFCDFCGFINSSNECLSILKNSSLILFEDKYYLIINNLGRYNIKNFDCAIAEFSDCATNNNSFENKLREYGVSIY